MPAVSVGSSGLLRQEALVMLAEKRHLFFLLFSLSVRAIV